MKNASINRLVWLVWLGLMVLLAGPLRAGVLIEWDFTQGTHGWTPNGRVAPLACTQEGLVVRADGLDPWIEGPAIAIPADSLVRLTLRLRTTSSGSGQIFYGPSFVAERVRSFVLFNDDQWHDYEVMIGDGLGPATRFRFDPGNDAGMTVLRSIRIETIVKPKPPVYEKPIAFTLAPSALSCRSEALAIQCGEKNWGAFAVTMMGREMARGYTGEVLSILSGEQTDHIPLGGLAATVTREGAAVVSTLSVTDSGGGHWQLQRRFEPVTGQPVILVTVSVSVDREREAVAIPWLTLLPGLETFGSHKHQALFAGLEYLADEPSSSTADIEGQEHIRRVPDDLKITFPLMALEQEGAGIGLIWEKSERVAAGFDSPDTVYGSGAHAFWLSGPAVGERRFANDLIAHSPIRLEANRPMSIRAWIVGTEGPNVIPAVQAFVRLKGWPDLPEFEGGYQRAVTLLAHGWLDSELNQDFRFRHAVWGDSFGPIPAADAAFYMRRLADESSDTALADRLQNGVTKTLAQLGGGDPFASGVSHVRPPAPPLLFGRVDEFVQLRRREAQGQLGRFDDQGRIIYHPAADRPDYGRTHYENHANGMSGLAVAQILETAVLSGDGELGRAGLDLLDKQTRLYANSVPRGAQTWEVPLHTPDILASAHLIRAYVYGYLLSNRAEYLEQARYWAWTGVPFLYLVNPTEGAVGPYATIAVLGATNWSAPVWFGQPVQWCGLVYGSALHLLADYDNSGPWRQLARGITLAGLQMTWPESDSARQGLLPDFYHLRQQISDGPAINPGTVGAHMPQAFNQPPLYTLKKLNAKPWFLHAPCQINDLRESAGRTVLTLAGVGDDDDYYLLVSGLTAAPLRIVQSGSGTAPREIPFSFTQPGFLTIRLKGKVTLTIETQAG